MAGRPTKYNKEIATQILELICTTSKSLRTIAAELDISVASILNWLRDYPEFLAQYTRAKQEQADILVEEMIDIADDGSNDFMTVVKGDIAYEQENKEVTNRSRLRVDTRKWIAAKLKPKKYGDKLDIQQTSINHNVELSKDEIKEIAKGLDEKY